MLRIALILLKFYNELAANTNFKMPLRSLLEFDAKVFMRHLNKLSRAHKVELRWIRKSAKEKAEEMLSRDYARIRAILKEEMTIVM